MTKVCLGIKEDGSEKGLPCTFVEIDGKSTEQEVLKECQKYFPYRLVELKPNFNADIVNTLINNGFEVIVNLDTVRDINKICRAAKIRLTLDINEMDLFGVQNLAERDEIKFLVGKKEDIERLKGILTESLTRARVFITLKENATLKEKELVELLFTNTLPISIE
jgi:hypothetical protein